MMWGAEQRKSKQSADDEAERRRLHAQAGSVHPIRVPVAAGECAGRAGPGAGAGAEESHREGRKLLPDQAGGEHNRIQPQVQVLHHDEAAEPALLPGGGGEGDAAQLHDHAGGAAGPAAGGGGEARAAGPGGREDAAGAAGRGEREAAQGDGGPHHRGAIELGGQHPGGRDRHQHHLVVQRAVHGDQREAEDRRGDGGEDRPGAPRLRPRRRACVGALLHRLFPRQHRPYVPILPRLVRPSQLLNHF